MHSEPRDGDSCRWALVEATDGADASNLEQGTSCEAAENSSHRVVGMRSVIVMTIVISSIYVYAYLYICMYT